jgi:protoheme IX farnesyltransferase
VRRGAPAQALNTHPEVLRDPSQPGSGVTHVSQAAPTVGQAHRAARAGAPGAAPRRSLRGTLRAYLALTKPRIIELLLITTLPVMFLAARGLPPLWPAFATLAGGAASAAGANALNCYIDRDIDKKMRRTRRRPLAAPAPSSAVTPRAALIFGIVLAVASTCWLWLAVNWLSAGLALFANLFYVFGYSLLLKRRTAQNIVWGGLAGCMPALIGWTAITGRLSLVPLPLFLVVFFWTPPHFWALAMRFKEDYAAADVPMLPVIASDRVVTRSIIRYSWAMVACSLLLWPVARTGPLYPAAAAIAGAWFLAEAYRLGSRARGAAAHTGGTAAPAAPGVPAQPLRPMRLFHSSNTYLALLFLAVAVDSLLR